MNEDRFQILWAVGILLLVIFKPDWLAPFFLGMCGLICLLACVLPFLPMPPVKLHRVHCPRCGRWTCYKAGVSAIFYRCFACHTSFDDAGNRFPWNRHEQARLDRLQ